jgi:hypothetical protein
MQNNILYGVYRQRGRGGGEGWFWYGISVVRYTDKKENKIVLTYKDLQMGSFAKSYMRKGFLICEEMLKYLSIFEEAVSHI